MAGKPDLGLLMAMGPAKGGKDAEPPPGDASGSDAPPDSSADMGGKDVSDEELSFAKDLGFSAGQASSLKRFVRSCIEADEAGDYDEAPQSESGEQMNEEQPK